MARRRNKKGQFKRRAKGRKAKSRRQPNAAQRRRRNLLARRRRRGMGSIVTVRRRGMGAINYADVIVPVIVGGGVAMATTLIIKKYLTVDTETKATVVRWSPLLGLGAATVAAGALGMMRGGQNGTLAFAAAASLTAYALLEDRMERVAVADELALAEANRTAAEAGGQGFGAIVPEYSRPGGMGAITMESVGGSGRRRGTIGGAYGATVSLQGVNTSVFGTPGFHA